MPSENYSIEYAYVSQRGYYPEAPNKTNQDTYCVQTEFMGNPNSHLFGVFDGHGTQGTACSSFARDKVRACPLSHSLPSGRNIVLEVACVSRIPVSERGSSGESRAKTNARSVRPQVTASLQMDAHFTENVPAAFTRAFVETNSRLHLSTVDDSCSGTTAIMGYLDGKQLCVANVGDSRACCGVRSGNKLLAVDLSHDQTPFRRVGVQLPLVPACFSLPTRASHRVGCVAGRSHRTLWFAQQAG